MSELFHVQSELFHVPRVPRQSRPNTVSRKPLFEAPARREGMMSHPLTQPATPTSARAIPSHRLNIDPGSRHTARNPTPQAQPSHNLVPHSHLVT
eukprot:5961086-Prymnesium_polylepis.4